MNVRRSWVALLLLVLGLESAGIVFLLTRERWRRQAESRPVARGERVAASLGCFACHGPGGTRPIPNPGARGGEVPQWAGGTWMMWNDSEDDVRAWILDGHPESREPDPGALIKMPTYRGRVGGQDLEDLVAYVLAVSQFGWPEAPGVSEGRDVAVRFGCFGCHGPEGRGLVLNPGSFTGYIPPWDGEEYLELVRSDEEFRQWVRQGTSERFRKNPLARRFLERQAVPMPAYEERISDQELEKLLAYVRWLREKPARARGARAPIRQGQIAEGG